MKDFDMSAAALYDGGWRAEDKEQLMAEYDLSEAEATEICEWLKKYEESDKD